MDIVSLLRALAHPVRLRIVELLSSKPMRWNEIYTKLRKEGYVISPTHFNFHLDVLVRSRLVIKRAEEKDIVYVLNPELEAFVDEILKSKTKIALRGA